MQQNGHVGVLGFRAPNATKWACWVLGFRAPNATKWACRGVRV